MADGDLAKHKAGLTRGGPQDRPPDWPGEQARERGASGLMFALVFAQ
jgi:hypothetical protein